MDQKKNNAKPAAKDNKLARTGALFQMTPQEVEAHFTRSGGSYGGCYRHPQILVLQALPVAAAENGEVAWLLLEAKADVHADGNATALYCAESSEVVFVGQRRWIRW